MSDFIVDPSQIIVAAAQVKDAGTTVGTAGHQLAQSTIAHPIFGTDYSVNEFSQGWSTALKEYAEACATASQNLNNTANDYQTTEAYQAGILKGML